MVGMIDSEVTLVSVHIPKTGGMTLLSILQQVYVGHLQLAYEDERDTIVEKPLCYHGHAVLDKFANNLAALPNVKWMTFLRDPLRSAVSLYHYGVKHGTIREMGLDQWLTGTEMFCWPDPPAYNHNRFSKWIGRARTSWDQFDLIGLTEYFDESIQLASDWNIGDQKITYAITQLLGPSWKSPTHWGTLLHTMPESPDMWNIPTGWHWDSDPLDIINGKEGLFIFIFMSHVLPQGGGTLILEGAHKLLLRYHRRSVEAKGGPHNTFFKAHPWLVDLRNNTGPMNERVARLMEQNAEIENIKVRVVELTGEPGDAVLCHPLIVHARSQNASKVPRFMLAKRIWREQT